MIYAASLSIPTKRAMKNNCMQSSMPRIISQMNLDPTLTTMDTVIIGPADLAGTNKDKMEAAMKTKHPGVCVIYVYEKEQDKDKLNTEFKKQCKKIKDQVIRDACEEFLTGHLIKQGRGRVTSKDFIAPEEQAVVTEEKAKVTFEVDEPVAEWMPTMEDASAGVVTPTVMPDTIEPSFEDMLNKEVTFEPVPEVEAMPTVQVPLTTQAVLPETMPSIKDIPERKVEDYMMNIHNFEDWVLFREQLQKDSIVRALIEENTEYMGLINILDVLDRRITTVWADTALSAEQKFEKIKELGLERSIHKAAANSMNVEKAMSIISTITMAAKRTVEERIASIDTAMYKISTDKKSIADTSHIDKSIAERSKIQLELLEMGRAIVDLYKSMDMLTTDLISELDAKLPSANMFINEMMKPVSTTIFTPQNTASLANRLLNALQENRMTASMMEESVNNTIRLFFTLIDKDTEIITKQRDMINLLKANRVEDFVIVNGVLKGAMNLYTGADNSGRTATALTWSGILSRRSNVLLVDLTGRPKFKEYGIKSMDLQDFLDEREERPLLCVESLHKLNPIELQDLMEELKTRLNYYKVINVIVAPEDISTLDQLSTDAFCVHYITNCTQTSIDVMHNVIESHKSSNIARKLITIDSPVNPVMIAEKVGADATQTRIIMLPNVPGIRACTITHDRPYEYTDAVTIFEEAFR